MKRVNGQEDDQLDDQISKLWNDKSKKSQQVLTEVITSLNPAVKQEILKILETLAKARPPKIFAVNSGRSCRLDACTKSNTV
jgi:predicted site-specific integrase-resolvase